MKRQEQIDYEALIGKLKSFHPEKKKAMIGLDGFVDEVLHVVKKRYDETHFDRIEYLADYGNMIAKSAGLSLNVEMVPIRRKLGGNGAIFANSLSIHGIDVTYIGACGSPALHPVFEEMAGRSRIISICEPAYTDAIEFKDGKIISSKLERLNDVNWQQILSVIDKKSLIKMIESADMLGFENWTMVMHMSDIWEHLLADILPHVKKDKKPKLFIDLADPSKRPEADILQAIHILEEFEEYFEVILGLNKKEANLIAGILTGREQNKDVDTVAEFLKQNIHISEIVVHTAKMACVVTDQKSVCVQVPYCKEPKQTTGAGDSFNAGYMLGKLIGVSPIEALTLGNANAGYYIRNAHNANCEELQNFLMYLKDERGEEDV